MIQNIFKQVGWFVTLVVLQALVFNNIHIAQYATPMPYIYFLLILSSDTPRAALLIWGFVLGLTVDIFACTPGVATASMTLIGFVRPYLLPLFAPSDKDDEAFIPSTKTIKWGGFITYAVLMAFIQETVFFSIEAFSFFNWEELLINIGGSLILTILMIMAFEAIRSGNNLKRRK